MLLLVLYILTIDQINVYCTEVSRVANADGTYVTANNDHQEMYIYDKYIQFFFEHTGEAPGRPTWVLKKYKKKSELCCICGYANRCIRMRNKRLRASMKHLYIDLLDENNAHFDNREKRYVCYRYYTFWLNGRLQAGDRRRVCPCVMEEIRLLFPSTSYQGFSDLSK